MHSLSCLWQCISCILTYFSVLPSSKLNNCLALRIIFFLIKHSQNTMTSCWSPLKTPPIDSLRSTTLNARDKQHFTLLNWQINVWSAFNNEGNEADKLSEQCCEQNKRFFYWSISGPNYFEHRNYQFLFSIWIIIFLPQIMVNNDFFFFIYKSVCTMTNWKP